ncbi:MAG TPA: hypothetical protein VH482_04915 [Thermomicrobiales bacterium]|jgi:hypothetical protein
MPSQTPMPTRNPRPTKTPRSRQAPDASQTPLYIQPPISRQLRCYAIDPSLAQRFETAPISETVLRIPWESVEPGPVDEYLEVIDYDPSSQCFYEPVCLDDPYLLAQDGLPPSEGTPQFHQQMAYGVARLTIQNFERALGRRAVWSPGPSLDPDEPKNDANYVQRLRIYPHALQEANAYYSPAKKALLFGYFPASSDAPGDHVPGSIVFSCLSHDIVAHETTHALLDGVHRRLGHATNPDMLAFHEAFADIVALFQHFTFPDILYHQIATSRGDIRQHETMLGQLAGQFGRATGRRSALRDAIGTFNPETNRWEPHKADPAEYEQTFEPHDRGAILVAAVFDAFLAIYGARVADLVRLVTGGTGVLPAGDIHPDLVKRLADEASKAAGHVLTMCVRALDYCPPVDLTFGEYLRAIVTADVDLIPDDDHGYRVSFVDAFRARGLYPRDLRTLSVENLIWRRPQIDPYKPSAALVKIFGDLREFGNDQLYAKTRRDLFFQARSMRAELHKQLRNHFLRLPKKAASEDRLFLGLDPVPESSFEVHSLDFSSRVGPDGDLLLQAIVQITQTVRLSGDGDHPERVPFEGGCTLVVDLEQQKIRYCIRKPVTSKTRAARQSEFRNQFAVASTRSTYFGDPATYSEPFALLHRS